MRRTPELTKPSQRQGNDTRTFYDRIASVQGVGLRLSGYRVSVAKYLMNAKAVTEPGSHVLDAGSGTGIMTEGFYKAGFDPELTVALDLSFRSLSFGAGQFRRSPFTRNARISSVQGNVLQLPFGNETFDLVLSCGVLEYVSLNNGLAELARVVKPLGKLILIPIRPSVFGSVLEYFYRFKTHPPGKIREAAIEHFELVDEHEFPFTEVMGWSKMVFLLEKKRLPNEN